MRTAFKGAQFLEIGTAARSLGLSITRLRQLEAEGRIPHALRTDQGTRIYRPEDVEAIKHAREAMKREPALTG